MTASGPHPARVACTIVDGNYSAQANVLATSYLAHHPDHRFVTLLIDVDHGEVPTADLPGEMFTLADLGMEPSLLRSMMAIYDVLEFATALKAAMLQRLLREHETALYLDPDMLLLGRLDDMFDAADAHGVALTPHVLQPMPRDGLEPAEDRIRHSGIFNLGMVAVGQGGTDFLSWWAERLATEAVVDLPRALFTDQRWIDWVPALWQPAVLRDPGVNVAYWNLHERPLTEVDGVLHAGGSPVRLLHFSGYDPAKPWQLSKHAGTNPRVRLGDDPVLRRVCDDYAARLALGRRDRPAAGYRWATTPDGVRLTPLVRAALRRAVALAASGQDSLPADPFAPGALRDWLDSPAPGEFGTTVGRWALAYYESEIGLQQHFPRLDLDDAAHYQEWLPRFEPGMALREAAGLGAPPAPPVPVSSYERECGGWNVVAYGASEHGVGEAGRRLLSGMDLTGLPVEVVALTAHGTRNEHRTNRVLGNRLRFRDSIYCINADMLPAALARLEHYHRLRADARRIGLWFWELDVMPPEAAGALDCLEQVWVTSDFTAAAVRSLGGDVPVQVITLPVAAPSAPTPFTRAALGLPEGYLVSGCFDHHSVMERKNPLDLVRAYRAAFPRPGEASLVLKTMNGRHHPLEADRLRRAVEDRPDILLVDDTWSAGAMRALLELSDCYVSVHRSEGFGLNIADAMALGTPTVVTAYSGNMRFCTEATNRLVPYTLVPVGPGQQPYAAEAEWAQPDVDTAAHHLRDLFEHPQAAAAMADAARAHVLDVQSPARAAAELRTLLLGEHQQPLCSSR